MKSILYLTNCINKMDTLASVNTFGVLTYTIGTKDCNSFSDFLLTNVYPQMRGDYFQYLFDGLSSQRKVRKLSTVYLTTDKAFAETNALISYVDTKDERTISVECLYTDDESFSTERILSNRITNDFAFKRIQTGKLFFILPRNTYVFKIISEHYRGDFMERSYEYVIYIPSSNLR